MKVRSVLIVAAALAVLTAPQAVFALDAPQGGTGGLPGAPVVVNPGTATPIKDTTSETEAPSASGSTEAVSHEAAGSEGRELADEAIAGSAPVNEARPSQSASPEIEIKGSATAEGAAKEDAAEDAALTEAARISQDVEAKEKAAVAAEAPAPPPEPTLIVDVDLARQRMTVTERDRLTYTWPVSSGRRGYATPTGTFSPVWMTKMWYSRQYDYAPMPHSIFFSGGAAIHATSAVGQLGRPASHGCVRLSPSNAATLFKLVSQHGKERVRISVHGKPDYDAEIASRRYYEPRFAERFDYRRGYAYGEFPEYARRRAYGYDYYQRDTRRARRAREAQRRYQPRGYFGNSYVYGY